MCSDRNPDLNVRIRRAAACIAAALFMCAPSVARAHDFWIQPTDFTPAPASTLDLRLIIGHDDIRTEFPRDRIHLVAFVCFDPEGKVRKVPGILGQIAGRHPLVDPGLHLFAYRSQWNFLAHKPNGFAAYLKDEDLRDALKGYLERVDLAAGLPQVAPPADESPHDPVAIARLAAQYARTIRAGCRPVREQFSRCAKSLVAVGKATHGKHDRRVGLPLEIVAETNPYATTLSTPQTYRVFLKGQPRANMRLAAYRESKPSELVEARTDAQGRATLMLDEPGMWIVRCIRVEYVGASRVDWQSLWATLTFARK